MKTAFPLENPGIRKRVITFVLARVNHILEQGTKPPPLAGFPGVTPPPVQIELELQDLFLLADLATRYHNLMLAVVNADQAGWETQVGDLLEQSKKYEWIKA